jgi:hypothetical protein
MTEQSGEWLVFKAPPRPKYLEGGAADLWDELVPQLVEQRVLLPGVDEHTFAVGCMRLAQLLKEMELWRAEFMIPPEMLAAAAKGLSEPGLLEGLRSAVEQLVGTPVGRVNIPLAISATVALLVARVAELEAVLRPVLEAVESMTPDLSAPAGGWDAWEDEARKALATA